MAIDPHTDSEFRHSDDLDYFERRWAQAQRNYEQIQQRVDFRGKRVLDVGCWTGGECMQWSQLGAEAVYGLDRALPEHAMSAIIAGWEQKKAGAFTPRLVKADGTRIPFADESFDLITMHDVLEHLTTPRGVIDECRRVLKRGGLISIITPHYYGLSGNHLWNYLDERVWRYLHPHLLLPRPLLKAWITRIGRRRGFAEADIRWEWDQFAALNRLRVSAMIKLLRGFEIRQVTFRQAEASFVRALTRGPILAELFSYGVVIVAVRR